MGSVVSRLVLVIFVATMAGVAVTATQAGGLPEPACKVGDKYDAKTKRCVAEGKK